MIAVSSLHYGVLQQANHTDSEYLEQLTVPQRDYYLNKGKDIVIEWLTSLDETNDTVRRYLQQIVIRNKELPVKLSGKEYIADFPADFFKHKALYGIATRKGCSTERRVKIGRPGSEKYQTAIINPNTNRIWDFEKTFALEAFDGLHVLTEEDVTLRIFLDYIRKVRDVAYPSGADGGSYIGSDGNPVTEDVHLELDTAFFHNKIVNMAVLEIKKDYSHPNDYQVQRDFILSIDRI